MTPDTTEDRRCGTCEEWKPVPSNPIGGHCRFSLPAELPPWVRWTSPKTGENQCEDCEVWKRK